MTTPNIKALAERIANNPIPYRNSDEGIQQLEDSKQLASALLRALKDGENMAKELVEIQTHVNAIANKTNVNWYSSALESHNKLMEELNENIKS